MNDSQAAAYNLVGVCNQAIISNVGAATTPDVDDPLNTVYEMGWTFARQVWWKITNTTGVTKYARFVLTNTSGFDIDLAAAVYAEDPAAFTVSGNLSPDHSSNWDVSLAAGGDSFSLGAPVRPGETVWLEIAGDDGEGDGLGWNGDLSLTWMLVDGTFRDAPDAGYHQTTQYRGALQASTHPSNVVNPVSYCRSGDLHFAAVDLAGGGAPVASDLRVWVWTDGGGAPTEYNISSLDSGVLSSIQIGAPQLRSDGTHVWLVAYTTTTITITCGSPPTAHNVTQHTVAVFAWNGSGFTLLGTDTAATFPFINGYDGGHYIQVLGHLDAAASSAEPGVLHVMWSEGGPRIISTDIVGGVHTCVVDTFTERVAYSRWSHSGAVVTGADVATSSSSSSTGPTPLVTQYLFVTNAFGAPIAFYGVPTSVDLLLGTIDYTAIVDMWSIDETTGAPTTLRTINGTTIDPSVVSLTSQFFKLGGTRLPPQTLYTSVDTIFLVAPWITGASALVAPLLHVPADGSAAIAAVPSIAYAADYPITDAYHDGRNVWLGTGPVGVSGQWQIRSGSLTCAGGEAGFNNDGSRYLARSNPWLEFEYDSAGDGAFYALGADATAITTTTKFAPLKIPILRDFLTCTAGDCTPAAPGLHIWKRL